MEFATRFLDEMREAVATAVARGAEVPPRFRSVHETLGHATPEYRTVAIPIPPELGAVSPQILSTTIAHFAADKHPDALALAFPAVCTGDDGKQQPVLISELRDAHGFRRYRICRYAVRRGRVVWQDRAEDASRWLDPGEEEMVLDAAFAAAAVEEVELEPVHA